MASGFQVQGVGAAGSRVQGLGLRYVSRVLV